MISSGDTKKRAMCQHHNFACEAAVVGLSDKEGGPITGYSADIRIKCTDCGAPMRFLGPAFGISRTRPMVSPDRTELRVPMEVEILPEILDRPEDGRSGTA